MGSGRVEFLIKTDSRYPKEKGDTFLGFTLTTPENPLRFHSPRSSLQVSVLAYSRGRCAQEAEGL